MAKKEWTSTEEPNLILPFATSYNARNIAGYTQVVTNADDQRKINWIYEPVTNGLVESTTIYLAKRPGVADSGSSFGTSGQEAYLMEVAAGALTSAAANRWVFSISGDDIRASDASQTVVIATAAGYEPVYVDKAIFGGNDTVIIQLRNASGTQSVYYSTAIATWTQISDADFTGLTHRGKMEFGPGRAHIMSGNRIYSSDLDSLSAWSATSFITKQVQQDIGTGLARLGKLYIAFGESTFEVFHDIGNPTGTPLEALPDKFQRFGMASTIVTGMRHYYTVLGQHMFWVSKNPKGVFAYNGETVEKVSSLGIDKILAEQQHYHVGLVSFQGQTGIGIVLTSTGDATQRMLVYFPAWKDWFEWTSTVFVPITSSRLTTCFLGNGSNGHKLYDISETSNNYQDAGTSITSTIQFKLPSTGNQIKRMPFCGVIGDTAPSADTLSVSWSNDDYQNFSTARTIDMTKMTKMLKTCGSYRDRVMQISHSGTIGCRLEKFIARVV